MKHIFYLNESAKKVPGTVLPDGAITGNGDLSVIWAGSTDRVHLYIGKSDFWNSDGNAHHRPYGGMAPLGIIELLFPQFTHSPYQVEQDIDNARLTGYYTEGRFNATLTVTVCAEENTILLELDRTFPGLSASVTLLPLEGKDAITECGEMGEMSYTVRGFDSEYTRFPTYGISVLREISRSRNNSRERVRWAISVVTNHDTAAYRNTATEQVSCINDEDFENKLKDHSRWWRDFWSRSSVSLPDKDLENHWYMGLYVMACCSRNKKFPPGLWGSFGTADGQGWFGDYHLNYNYESPFYALTSANHVELTDCYLTPILDFLPKAKVYSRQYLGCRGAYYPVSIGPMGLETDVRAETKEHGHLFLGQKSNGAYAAVVPMMRWYSTRDEAYGKLIYPFLREIGDFWEDYLVYENEKYVIYNDALHEIEWWSGADFVPKHFGEVNAILSLGLVCMVMKLLIDLSKNLNIDCDRIGKWQHILDHLSEAKTEDKDGSPVLLESYNEGLKMDPLSLRYMFPAEQIGKYSTPELYRAARNTLEKTAIWDHGNMFCEFYIIAARLEYPPEMLISHIRDNIKNHQLPNGLFSFFGGGIENSASILGTVNEMLLQSNEHILRLFPCWDKSRDASFCGLRAYGAFVVDGSVKDGEIHAQIQSEKGEMLRIERPDENYSVIYRGKTVPLDDRITEFETIPGELITLIRKSLY